MTNFKLLPSSFEEMKQTYDAAIIGAGFIMVDDQMQTNISNVYAAGDATCGRKYQIAASVGQGATAALNIIKKHVEAPQRQH